MICMQKFLNHRLLKFDWEFFESLDQLDRFKNKVVFFERRQLRIGILKLLLNYTPDC